jgi:hypothetical protein
MRIQFLYQGEQKTALIEPAECRVSDQELCVWTEHEFQSRFFPDDAAVARVAYRIYVQTYSPPSNTEAGRFIALLRAGRIDELEREYVISNSGSSGRKFSISFRRRTQLAKKRKRRSSHKKRTDSRASRKGRNRKKRGPRAWLIYTPFETNRRKH